MAAIDLTGSYVSIDPGNISTEKTSVQQLVDIVQTDIASSQANTRKKYEVFTSGGIVEGVNTATITSSLYQTVYDQDFSLGTSNALFDVTVGSYAELQSDNSFLVNNSVVATGGGGKLNSSLQSPMTREKVNIYRQFSQNLLGDASASFMTPHDAVIEETNQQTINESPGTYKKKIRGAIFICFRRLFTRDNIFKGSFGLRVHKRAGSLFSDASAPNDDGTISNVGSYFTNIDAEVSTSDYNSDASSPVIYDDRLVAGSRDISPVAGEVSTLANSNGDYVGVIFYDSGIIVLDVERAFDAGQNIRGLIDSTRTGDSLIDLTGPYVVYGNDQTNGLGYYYPVYTANNETTTLTEINSMILVSELGSASNVVHGQSFWYDAGNQDFVAGSDTAPSSSLNLPLFRSNGSEDFYSDDVATEIDGKSLHTGTLYPSLWSRGTIDNIIDHICDTRFGRSERSAITFRNETIINSSLIFCRASQNQFNYSTNPSYTNANNDIIALNTNNRSFTFITTVGLYDAEGFLLAVAKTSRPIEKNSSTDLSIRIRLDY